MQRNYLLFCLIFSLLALHSARADAGNDPAIVHTVAFGGKVGMNAVDLGGEGADGAVLKTRYKMSIAAGGYANVSLHEWFAIQPELLYTMKGSGREANGVDRGTYDINYIEIPLLLQGRLPVRRNLHVHGLLGPALSFLVDAKIENENGEVVSLDEELKSTDIGLIFGAGATWRHSRSGAVVIEMRYDLGLSSIDKDDGDDVKTRAFTLMLGYQWALGAK